MQIPVARTSLKAPATWSLARRTLNASRGLREIPAGGRCRGRAPFTSQPRAVSLVGATDEELGELPTEAFGVESAKEHVVVLALDARSIGAEVP